MRREEAGGAGIAGDEGVEADDDIGLGGRALELDAAEGADAVLGGDVVDRAAAGRLEAGLERRAGAPFGGEGIVGVDGEGGLVLRRGRVAESEESRKREGSKTEHAVTFSVAAMR